MDYFHVSARQPTCYFKCHGNGVYSVFTLPVTVCPCQFVFFLLTERQLFSMDCASLEKKMAGKSDRITLFPPLTITVKVPLSKAVTLQLL